MKSMLLAVLALSVLSPPALVAADESCADLHSPWFDRYITDFHVKWDTTHFACPGGEGTLAQAFYDLEHGEFRPTPTGYRPDFYAIVKKNIKALRYDPDCKYLATGRKSDGTMTVCQPFMTDSREDRASTLVHESRHLESDDPSHVNCVGGKYNGNEMACDDTFYDGTWKGSGFNADIFFLNWNLVASTRNELSRSVIQADMNYMIPDRFNHITPEQIKKWRGN